MSTSSSTSRISHPRNQRPKVVLSFLTWGQRDRDMRGRLAQVLRGETHFSEGQILSAMETDVAEEMGDPVAWYPVAHLRSARLGGTMNPRDTKHDTKNDTKHDTTLLGGHFTLLQDTYYEHTKLNLMMDKGGSEGRGRSLLILAYKSLEEVTEPGLLEGWVRWSGAWEAYTLLQERHLPVSTITLYVREPMAGIEASPGSGGRRRKPRESFKYVVVVEVLTISDAQEQQLRATTQRLRVERWSGYTGLYTIHTLQDFADSFSSTDSITRIVGEL